MKLHNNVSLATKSLIQSLVGCLILIGIVILGVSTFAAYQRADEDGTWHTLW